MAEAGNEASAEALAEALVQAKSVFQTLELGAEALSVEAIADTGELCQSLTKWLAKSVRLRLAEAEAEGTHWRWRGWPDYIA